MVSAIVRITDLTLHERIDYDRRQEVIATWIQALVPRGSRYQIIKDFCATRHNNNGL